MGLADGSILSCDDFLPCCNQRPLLYHTSDELKDGAEFELVGDLSKLEASKSEEEEPKKDDENRHKNGAENGSTKNGDSKNGEGDRKRKTDDDIEIVEEAVPAKKDGDSKNGEGDRKRKTDDDVEIAEEAVPAKKAKTAAATAAEDDE